MKKGFTLKSLVMVSSFSFVVLLLVVLSYSYSVSGELWYLDLLGIRFLSIPFLLYLLLFSFIIGLLVSAILYFVRQKQWQQLEDALKLLADGHYSSQPLEGFFDSETDAALYLADIHKHIEVIRQKLIELSKEVQQNSNRPKMVDGETKEKILEKERQRLARELHDSVSQQLFAAMMLLSALNQQLNGMDEAIQMQLNRIESIVNEAQSEMRALLLHLRPVNLEGKSLREGIEQLLVELKTKIQIILTWEVEDISLQSGIEDHLFRIVQELLSNTLRHSKAKELEVYLNRIGDSVLLRVIDDGIGFDPDEGKAGNYGIQNIKERAASMGGTCKIISFTGKGTSVEIRVPIIKRSEEV